MAEEKILLSSFLDAVAHRIASRKSIIEYDSIWKNEFNQFTVENYH